MKWIVVRCIFRGMKSLMTIIPLSCVSRDFTHAASRGQSNTDPQNLGEKGTREEEVESLFPKCLFRSDSSPSPVLRLHRRTWRSNGKLERVKMFLIIRTHEGFSYDNCTYYFHASYNFLAAKGLQSRYSILFAIYIGHLLWRVISAVRYTARKTPRLLLRLIFLYYLSFDIIFIILYIV